MKRKNKITILALLGASPFSFYISMLIDYRSVSMPIITFLIITIVLSIFNFGVIEISRVIFDKDYY